MHAALLGMVKKNKLDPLVTQTQQLKDIWQKRIKMFTREGETLFWGGKIVPTVEQMEDKIIPLHYEKGHSVDMRVMRDALTAKGYGLPSFLGGLERACKL